METRTETHTESNLQNLGELLKDYKDPKVKSKIDERTDILNAITKMVKAITYDDTLEEAKAKMEEVIRMTFHKHHLVNHMSYLDRKRSTAEVIAQGYNLILMKDKQLTELIEASENFED